MRSLEHHYGADCTEAELLALIAQLNADPTVHGLLVQLPLPKQIDSAKVLDAIDPAKDVEAYHPVRVGPLWTGTCEHVPRTWLDCRILHHVVVADEAGRSAKQVRVMETVGG